ncbi:hypothetical protein DFP72DRAFT_530294 [Ephemerocybe angulata]|uniref:F-box domain-containing protein n=1 Tax=Ephemerocybe angulata TaxID=980116 RepID=A0A8H6MGA6_9AGAR|nr:hypothetical protein DFP72DRAFT_530294 [Tulosesus angulatus]
MNQSQITQYFANNAAPNPVEMASIREEIEHRLKAIQEHQDAIQVLQSELQAFRAASSPMRRFPPEILGEIFEFSLSDLPKYELDRKLVEICSVCKPWRSAAFSTLHLWRSVAIDPWRPHTVRFDKVSTWLRRSGGLSKWLALSGPECDGGPCPMNDPSLATLLAEGPLLHHLTLLCPSICCFRNLIGLVEPLNPAGSRPWDSLQSLKLEIKEWAATDESLEKATLLTLPPVKNLSLYLPTAQALGDTAVMAGNIAYPEAPSFTSLTTLELICDWPVRWISQVLNSCINVETLTLDFALGTVLYDALTPTETPSLLPKVRVLRLRRLIAEFDDADILQDLITPVLEELDISFENEARDICPNTMDSMYEYPSMDILLEGIESFLRKSKCTDTFRRFRLHSLYISSDTLMYVLGTLPPLTHLTLDDVDFPSKMFKDLEDMIVDPACPQFLPHLEHFELLFLPSHFDFEKVYSYLIARHGAIGNKLKKFVMTTSLAEDPAVPRQTDKGCIALRERGLEVSVGVSKNGALTS